MDNYFKIILKIDKCPSSAQTCLNGSWGSLQPLSPLAAFFPAYFQLSSKYCQNTHSLHLLRQQAMSQGQAFPPHHTT